MTKKLLILPFLFTVPTFAQANDLSSIQNEIETIELELAKPESIIDQTVNLITLKGSKKDGLYKRLETLKALEKRLIDEQRSTQIKSSALKISYMNSNAHQDTLTQKTEKEIADEKQERERLEKERLERERLEKERLEKEEAQKRQAALNQTVAQSSSTISQETTITPSQLQFNANGLLVEQASTRAQQVINLLMSIPGRANGAAYHAQTGMDALIDQLTVPEAVWVIHRIEGAGFGQTGAGYAGVDSPTTHQAFVNQQVNRRFGGSIHQLLKKWGTYSYSGY